MIGYLVKRSNPTRIVYKLHTIGKPEKNSRWACTDPIQKCHPCYCENDLIELNIYWNGDKWERQKFCCQEAEKMNQWTNPNALLSITIGKCIICKCDENYIYHVPENFWRKIIPKKYWNEIICAGCFHKYAKGEL